MQISSRFTLAVHIFACIDTFRDDYKVTSEFLAGSTNVNPVIIRKLLSQLKAAGLVSVARAAFPLQSLCRKSPFWTFIMRSRVWNTERCFISMKIQMRNARLGAISIGFWTINCCGCKMRWKKNSRPSPWRISNGIRKTVSVNRDSFFARHEKKISKNAM